MAKRKVIDEFANEWMSKIKAGIDFRKKYSTRSQWGDFRKMYRGQWAEGLVPVNKVFSYGRALIPRVYFRAPRVTVTASRPDLVWHAKVVEAIDNLLIKESLLKSTLKMSALDSYLCGTGPIKLGYDSEFGYLPEQAITADGETVTQVGREDGVKIEYKEGIKPGMPWALRVRPEDVVVPWGSQDSSSLPWIAHYILRPLDDVEQDQKYKIKEKLAGTRAPSSESDKSAPFRPREEKDKDVTYAELWEVRSLRDGKIYTLCENQLLMAEDDILQIEGLPWEFVMFNPDPEYFWGISDVHILSPQQAELNETRTQAARHRAIALLKFLYKRGAVKEEELTKFLSGLVGPAVAIDEVDNLANAIVIMQPHIPPDLYQAASVVMQDMKETLGFSSNQQGEFSSGQAPRTATESMIVQQGFEVRIDERKDIIADILTRIVRKWNQFIFRLWSEEKVVQIVSPQGEPFWVKYTGDQIRGEYLLTIDPDSGMPISQGLKYQMGKDLMGQFGGDPLIDQVGLRQIVLGNYEGIDPRVGKLLNVQPDMEPGMLAEQRQPSPQGVGGGKGSAGGRAGSSQAKPMEFEQFKNKMEGATS
jgi:hypothetical protein